MPRIDPLQLLNCLNVLLTPTGGIRSEQEVARISSLMEKFSKKLVSKCVYLLILKASDVHLLSKFMGLGGWNLICNWLVHAIEAKNYPFLVELLEVIIICPVDIERLKSNPMPRQIKYLSKDNFVDPRVRDLANDIVKHWLAIVKGTPSASPTANQNSIDKKNNDLEKTILPCFNNIQADKNEKLDEEVGDVEDAKTEAQLESSVNESHIISAGSGEDGNYIKSTSPSSSSADNSNDSDVFVPYKKPSLKKRVKQKSPSKKESLKELNHVIDKPKLKFKVISVDPKDVKKAPLKLKIEKKKEELYEHKMKKEKSDEEKIKEKRKIREDLEREKFAKFKFERGKKKREESVTDTKNVDKEKIDAKSKADLSKFIPKSLDKLGRIPKLSKDTDAKQLSSDEAKRKEECKTEKAVKIEEKKTPKKDENKSVTVKSKENEKEKDSKKLTAAPPKKPISISVEKRFSPGEVKPKTVKAYNSKFRLTGLEQEVSPKPLLRKLSINSSSSQDKNAVKRSPPKDVDNEPMEKKIKSPEVVEEKSPQNTKVKKPFLQESDFFMNAMTIAIETQKEQLRKRKKPPAKTDSDAKQEGSSAKKVADATSPIIKTASSTENKDVKPAFKFYKDTFESNEEGNNDSVSEAKESSKQSPNDKTFTSEQGDEILNESIESKENTAVGLKSSLSLFKSKKAPKKSVKWKSDDELEAIQYFEVDVSERTNVVRTFWDMQMMERSRERESMLMVRKISDNDKMAVQIKWSPLIPIDLAPPSTVSGVNSQEKSIQYARDRSVPPAIYFNKSMIPDTPAEPDLEIHPVTIPPVIPLDDISGSQDSVNDFSNLKWPEPRLFPSDGPDMLNVMNMGTPNFMAPGVPPPMFAPFPDGTFPAPYPQPFFPGGPVRPVVPGVSPNNWPPGNNDQQSQNQQQQPNQPTMPLNSWGVPPPNMVPPGIIRPPPPFGMMGPPFAPIPGGPFPGAPNMFPIPGMNPPVGNTNNSDNQQYSNNNFSNNPDSKKWNNDDRFYRKEGWKNSTNSDRGARDKRGAGSWRGSGSNSRPCRIFQKKGFCNISGCRFYHPEK